MNTTVNVRLALFAFVLLFSASVARAQSNPPVPDEKLTVVDSNGKQVGNVLGFDVCAGVLGPGAVPIVSFRVEGIRIVLSVGAENFSTETLGHCFNTLWFASKDCSGTAAYFNHVEEGFEEGGVAPVVPLNFLRGTEVFVPYGSPANVFLQSKLLDPETCETFPAEELSVTPLRPLIDLSNFFTPPFSIK